MGWRNGGFLALKALVEVLEVEEEAPNEAEAVAKVRNMVEEVPIVVGVVEAVPSAVQVEEAAPKDQEVPVEVTQHHPAPRHSRV